MEAGLCRKPGKGRTPSKDALVVQAAPLGEVLAVLKGCQKSSGYGHGQLGPLRLLAAGARLRPAGWIQTLAALAACLPPDQPAGDGARLRPRPLPLAVRRGWARGGWCAQPLALSSLQIEVVIIES